MTERIIAEGIALFLMIIGALAMLLAGVGVLRMPDVFMRMQATSKAATLGVGCMMLAVAFYFSELAVTTRAVAVIIFTFLTAPIGAHMIGRAAYISRAKLWDRTVVDDLRGRYDTAEERPVPDGDSPPLVGGEKPGRAERQRRRRERHKVNPAPKA